MSSEHELSPDLLRLMEQVACGDRSVDDAEVLAAAQEQAAFATWLDDWHVTVGQIDAAACMEREVVRDAMRTDVGLGGRQWLLLVAAVFLMALMVVVWNRSDGDRQPEFLGGGLQVTVAEDGVFHFGMSLPRRGSFTIEVANDLDSEPFLIVTDYVDAEWRPDRFAWPPMAVVRITAHDRSGDDICGATIRMP